MSACFYLCFIKTRNKWEYDEHMRCTLAPKLNCPEGCSLNIKPLATNGHLQARTCAEK